MRLDCLAAAAGCCLIACASPAGKPLPTWSAEGGCKGAEYRRLDFWLGEWDVQSPEGKREGRNRISATLDGCAVREEWSDQDGSRGESLFFFDRALGRWKQVWATSGGGWKEKLEQPGGEGEALRFQGELRRPSGGTVLDRTTLARTADGGVEQLIEQSIDGGAHWTAWKGLYRRRAASPACALPEHRQFDFWLGDWSVVIRARKAPGVEQWAEARGTNRVRSTFAGCVIEEQFEAGGPGAPWAGHSVSLFTGGHWRQTWVDDSGSYLAFQGDWQDGRLVLFGEPVEKEGKRTQMRMVFYDLTPKSLRWSWERTTDGGATWEALMLIEYQRR